MKENLQQINGILHQAESQKHYRLRRYFPDAKLAELVEQFWFVDWQLPNGVQHTQQNLPDPNFHLVIRHEKQHLSASLLGPVSKKYTYTMLDTGQIYGVKFVAGGLFGVLANDMASYVDKEYSLSDVLAIDGKALAEQLITETNDQAIVGLLQNALANCIANNRTNAPEKTRVLLQQIKSDESITSVDMLAEQNNLSVRAIQRMFKQYLGLTPKWLIRKYRLHQALAMLDEEHKDINEVIAWLGYTDQSHLIRDFKGMLGITPKQYTDPSGEGEKQEPI